MDKNTVEKEIKILLSEFEKQIENIKEKTDNFTGNSKVQTAVKTIGDKTTEFLEQVKDKVTNLWDYYTDPDEMAKIIENVKVVSKNVYNASLTKITEVKNSKDVQNALASTEIFLKKTYDKTSEVARDSFDKIMENEDIKKTFDSVVNTYNNVKDIVTEYFEKPEVQENIDKAKDITIDLAEKGVDALKKWLKANKKGK